MLSEHISHRSPAGCGAGAVLVIRLRTSYGVVMPARRSARPVPRWTAPRRAAAAGWDRGGARRRRRGPPRHARRRNALGSVDIAALAREPRFAGAPPRR